MSAPGSSDSVSKAGGTPASSAWTLLSFPWEETSASPSVASSGTDTPSDGTSDLSFWFRVMGLPRPESWARKFHNRGYGDMDVVSTVDLVRVFTDIH